MIGLIILAIFLLITYSKKKRQLGKIWDGPVSATVTIKEEGLQCTHCGHNKFDKREGLLTTTWVMLFNFAFWNESASCFVCKKCGFVHWFVSPEEEAKIERDPNY